MIRWFFRRQIAAFERTWNYDAAYVHELIDADPRAFMALGKVMGIGQYRRDIPVAAHHAAKIVSVMAEDCGPCTQLAIDTGGSSDRRCKFLGSNDNERRP